MAQTFYLFDRVKQQTVQKFTRKDFDNKTETFRRVENLLNSMPFTYTILYDVGGTEKLNGNWHYTVSGEMWVNNSGFNGE